MLAIFGKCLSLYISFSRYNERQVFLIKEKKGKNLYKIKSVGFIQYFWLMKTPESVNAQMFSFEHSLSFFFFLSSFAAMVRYMCHKSHTGPGLLKRVM